MTPEAEPHTQDYSLAVVAANTNSQAELDRAEWVQMMDAVLGMTKAKDTKPLLEKLRERLTK